MSQEMQFPTISITLLYYKRNSCECHDHPWLQLGGVPEYSGTRGQRLRPQKHSGIVIGSLNPLILHTFQQTHLWAGAGPHWQLASTINFPSPVGTFRVRYFMSRILELSSELRFSIPDHHDIVSQRTLGSAIGRCDTYIIMVDKS